MLSSRLLTQVPLGLGKLVSLLLISHSLVTPGAVANSQFAALRPSRAESLWLSGGCLCR
jgi:hypothetical protein